MIEELLEALEHWQERKTELQECHNDHAFDAVYHCYDYAEREEEARKDLEEKLNKLIDGRIGMFASNNSHLA